MNFGKGLRQETGGKFEFINPRDTAALLDKLGLPEYAAVEAFHEFDIIKGDHLPYM